MDSGCNGGKRGDWPSPGVRKSTYRGHMCKVFGEGWDSQPPHELMFQMMRWCDGDGELAGPVVSVSRETIMALALYVAETCEWKGYASYGG